MRPTLLSTALTTTLLRMSLRKASYHDDCITSSLNASADPGKHMSGSLYSLFSFSVCSLSLLVSSAASQLMMRCIHAAGGHAKARTHKLKSTMPADMSLSREAVGREG